MLKGWLAGIIIAVVVLGLVGWRVLDKNQQDKKLSEGQKARNSAAPTVDVALAGPQAMDDVVETLGSADSPYTVRLAPKLTGLVLGITVRQGDPVKAGQTLVSIDPTETEGQVLQAKQALAEAKYRLSQAILTTDPTNVGVQTAIKQQRAALNSAKADQNQVVASYKASVQAAQALVTDAEAKVAAAVSQVDVATQTLASAKASARNAQAKYDREEKLFQKGFVSEQDVDDARTALDVANAGVDGAAASLRSANSALNSAKAQKNSVQKNLEVVINKGVSDIADAKAHTEQADAALDLANSNRAQTTAYRANIEALRAEVGAAEGTLRQAQARLSDTNLRSTIDGTVTERSADPGSVVNAGTSILVVQFLDWLFVTGGIPIEDAPKISKGQTAEITFDAIPGKTFQGVLTQVVPSADPTSRQFTVQARLDNPGHLLKPGMFGKIRVVVEKHSADVAVPREAVTTDKSGNATVTIVDDQKVAHVTPVQIGRQNSKYVEIVSGIKPGDTVVTLSYQVVKDGKKVKPNAPKSAGGTTK